MRRLAPIACPTAVGRVVRLVAFVLAAVVVPGLLLLAGCGNQPPADWQWWSSADTAAVQAELVRWQGPLDARLALADTLRLNTSLPLLFTDSSSATGETLYKFKHVLDAWPDVEARGHGEAYLFSRTNDTVAMTDTFCQVDYMDTVMATALHFRYDSLWVVGYRPDTTVDTTKTPPETTIVFRASYTEARGFDVPQTLAKSYDWSARRVLHMNKDSAVCNYKTVKFTGCGILVPTAQDAPSITWVAFERPGRSDTFFYSSRQAPDLRGLYNLRPVDSLYTIGQNEPLDVTVVTSGDSAAERERFFVGANGHKTEITQTGKLGHGTVSFADTGYQHVYVQAVSVSGLNYTTSTYKTTYWAIPLWVAPRP